MELVSINKKDSKDLIYKSNSLVNSKNLNITLEKYTKYLKVEKTGRKTTFLDDEYFSFAQN